jgi:hypothetical protein
VSPPPGFEKTHHHTPDPSLMVAEALKSQNPALFELILKQLQQDNSGRSPDPNAHDYTSDGYYMEVDSVQETDKGSEHTHVFSHTDEKHERSPEGSRRVNTTPSAKHQSASKVRVHLGEDEDPNKIPVGKREVCVEVDEMEEVEVHDPVKDFIERHREATLNIAKEDQIKGEIFLEEVDVMIKGKGKMNLPKVAKLNRFFMTLSAYWYPKMHIHATKGAIYIKFVKDEYVRRGIEWLNNVKTTIASFLRINVRIMEVMPYLEVYSAWGMAKGLDTKTYLYLLFEKCLIPREGLKKVILYYQRTEGKEVDERRMTGLAHLVYSQTLLLFYNVGKGDTRNERQLTIPYANDSKLVIDMVPTSPKHLCFNCSSCGKVHSANNCNIVDGKLKAPEPVTPKKDIIIELKEQVKLWAFEDDEIPALNEDFVKRMEGEIIIDCSPNPFSAASIDNERNKSKGNNTNNPFAAIPKPPGVWHPPGKLITSTPPNLRSEPNPFSSPSDLGNSVHNSTEGSKSAMSDPAPKRVFKKKKKRNLESESPSSSKDDGNSQSVDKLVEGKVTSMAADSQSLKPKRISTFSTPITKHNLGTRSQTKPAIDNLFDIEDAFKTSVGFSKGPTTKQQPKSGIKRNRPGEEQDCYELNESEIELMKQSSGNKSTVNFPPAKRSCESGVGGEIGAIGSREEAPSLVPMSIDSPSSQGEGQSNTQ